MLSWLGQGSTGEVAFVQLWREGSQGTWELSGQSGSSQPARDLSSLPYCGLNLIVWGFFTQTNELSGTSHHVFLIKAANSFLLSSIPGRLELAARQDTASFPVLTKILTVHY